MDRSLEEIIAEDTHKTGRSSGGRRGQGRRRGDRDGIKKPRAQEPFDLNLDWVHDKYKDVADERHVPSRTSRRRQSPNRGSSGLTKVRVENLHYDVSEGELEELFERIGPVTELNVAYDRAGRSEGVAYITYKHLKDAHESIERFDGANAKGQPIRLSLIPGRRGGDRDERGGGSLFDRVGGRGHDRSLSPGGRRSDVSKPAPEHIDRYVPGSQTSNRRDGRDARDARRGRRDRRPRNANGNAENGGRRSNVRPRKTQEELDQEMEDYWGGNNGGETAAQPEQVGQQAAPAETAAAAAAPAATAPAAADDDIDMIE
ncbi:Nucleotide-binding alpha-beta plait [Penicillium argentinense]|uniref:Nucleotide-binding alpha-beta plait n=1 Tax=Penicillium argentinense TaxID=1131581 RepID=A0A9W9FG27_9EURO|nr:Nucleotide-binding alpha-beta plait [Penicillium argentinense]KAJ5099501.1 Nucleotide-binding alpha-beta plait [Penicillium argentinense]